MVHLPKVLVLQHDCPLLLHIGEVSSFLSLNLHELATTISISFKFSVILTSWFFNIFLALNEINFLRDFNLIFCVAVSKFLLTYWKTCNHKETEKHPKCCRSRDDQKFCYPIRYHFVKCILLLTYVPFVTS